MTIVGGINSFANEFPFHSTLSFSRLELSSTVTLLFKRQWVIGCYYDTGYTTRQVLLSLPSAIANYFTANVVIMALYNRLSVSRCSFFSEWVAGLAPYPIDLI